MVSGKGGVGKTSLSASLAVRLAAAGHPTLVVSTDPAHSLSDSLDQDVSGGAPVAVEGTDLPLWGLEVDPDAATAEFRASAAKDDGKARAMDLGGWGSGGVGLMARPLEDGVPACLTHRAPAWPTARLPGCARLPGPPPAPTPPPRMPRARWQESQRQPTPSTSPQGIRDFLGGMGLGALADQLASLRLGELLNTPPPGLDEAVAIAKVVEIAQSAEYARFTRVVIDTAPTGHTLRLVGRREGGPNQGVVGAGVGTGLRAPGTHGRPPQPSPALQPTSNPPLPLPPPPPSPPPPPPSPPSPIHSTISAGRARLCGRRPGQGGAPAPKAGVRRLRRALAVWRGRAAGEWGGMGVVGG